jgi:hypothetical protein
MRIFNHTITTHPVSMILYRSPNGKVRRCKKSNKEKTSENSQREKRSQTGKKEKQIVAMAKQGKPELSIIGWREWVGLPDLGIQQIKVKVDTGARSSSLHAFDLKTFEQDGENWVSFQVNPIQNKTDQRVNVTARVLEFRSVRSSSGCAQLRPVIVTHVTLLGITWPVELTLANRCSMGFRMLLGREAFRRRFLVDAGRSFYGGKPKKITRTSVKSNICK